jgi:hypothetical protein
VGGVGSLPQHGTASLAIRRRRSSGRHWWYRLAVIAVCRHVDKVGAVPPGRDVCETCMERGGTWKTLRQCLICGRTNCCDSSQNRHARAHYRETGHEIVRTLEDGQDWSWCYVDEQTLREYPERGWRIVDPFYEAGLWFAQRHTAETGGLVVEAHDKTPEGFPLGLWVATYRDRRRDGTLDPDQTADLEALPGWTW